MGSRRAQQRNPYQARLRGRGCDSHFSLQMARLQTSSCSLVGFASGPVTVAARASSPDFEGLAGLPLLRLMEYGGDADYFWVREPRLGGGSRTKKEPPRGSP